MLKNRLDEFTERAARRAARTVSRRSVVRRLGQFLVGAAAVPLLPVLRNGAFAEASAGLREEGDPNSCSYWRYCAIDGFLCSCCGGSVTSCPPGTVVSDVTWIGTCVNPTDGRHYVISYNDCCGKSACGSCMCARDEGDTPIYRPQNTNNLNWCAGSSADVPYHCSLAVVIGQSDQAG